ncbi:MAG: enoyl-[acyl-carrier-protein] reductase FabL [Caldilineaceae bacterium]|nr:enoyl-[acyl-carrier-protein] reductase FabL [Caldilineaceae bacterium]MCB0098142.1 enoyl-[acyl-carrier-protein] reductase FabL [Caldilineaceae bacterium]MCB0139496.1 enoyl-[acyl-carrier-protein] reductase FabL [Caldilineaceae bacterium]
MSDSLRGKTAVITGSGRGIGKGIALALAAQGCNIAINFFRRRQNAEETAREIEALGVRTALIKANVGAEEDVRRLVDASAEQLGSVDIFVGNAASGVQRAATEITAKAWDWTLNINARSILFGVQAAVPYMQRNGWGRIITISSIGSRRVLPEYSVVGVSKAAIEAVTRYLAIELAPLGIIANCISPGIVMTEALDHFPRGEEMIRSAQSATPVGRLVTPADVGALAVWLCSDAAGMIVGQTIELDGGHSLLMSGQI